MWILESARFFGACEPFVSAITLDPLFPAPHQRQRKRRSARSRCARTLGLKKLPMRSADTEWECLSAGNLKCQLDNIIPYVAALRQAPVTKGDGHVPTDGGVL
jgi:hypothetical protein